MFFLLAIWDFIFILGLFYTFLIFWIAFHRYTTFGRCGGPEKDQVFGVPLGLCFMTSLPGSAVPVGYLWALLLPSLCAQRKGWHP